MPVQDINSSGLQVELEELRSELARVKHELAQARSASTDSTPAPAHTASYGSGVYLNHPASNWLSLLEAHCGIVMHTDLDLSILYQNRTFSGGALDNIIGKHISEYTEPHKMSLIYRAVDYVRKTGKSTQYESVIESGGKPMNYLVYVSPVFDKGRINGLLFVFIDDTKRKEAESALKESEELYRSLIEMMPESVLVVKDGIIMYGNPQAYEKLGSSRKDELVGTPVLDLIHPRSKELVQNRINTIGENKRQLPPARQTVVSLGGEVYEAEVVSKYISYKGAPAILSINRDVSDKVEAERKLRASEERLRRILQNLRMIAIILDCEGKITFCNQYILDLFGLDPRELLGMSWFDNFVPDQLRGEVFARYKNAMATGEFPSYLENLVSTPQGDEIIVGWHNTPLKDAEGKVIAIASIGQDITRERKAAEELRRSEEKFRSLVESSGAGIAFFDRQGKILFVNQLAVALSGYAPQECLGRNVSEFNRPPLGQTCLQRIQSTIESDGHLTFEDKLEIAGGVRHLIFDYTTVRDDEGRISGVQVMSRDITRLRRTQEKLAESESNLQAIFNGAGVGIFVVDVLDNGSFRLADMNDLQGEMFGSQAERLIGKNLDNLNDRKLDGVFFRTKLRLSDCVKSRDLIQYEFHTELHGARTWWIRNLMPLVNQEGRVYKIIGAATQITSLKQAESEKQRLEIQLRQAQKMEAIGTLAGGIAHDFNNILSAIIGYTELSLEELPVGHEVHEYLKQVLLAGSRARNLVRQILSFSRPGSHEQGPLQMGPVVKEVMKLMRSSLPSSLDIRFSLQSQQHTVFADPTQIHQLVTNLVTNAAHAMENREGGIEVGLDSVSFGPDDTLPSPELSHEDYVHLWVKDTGHGMDAPTLARVFDPFFTTKETGRGTGMGLAVVHGIVKSHGGVITVQSELGVGSTFNVYLPALRVEEPAGHAEEQESVMGGYERVMWIDDEPLLAALGHKLLERVGYRVTSFTSSPDALEKFRACPEDFDLVITDFTMPKLTGGDLAREMLRVRPNLPIIICTGNKDRVDRSICADLGIKHYIVKPMQARDMCKVIREVLDGDYP